jgi:hypothetical protein
MMNARTLPMLINGKKQTFNMYLEFKEKDSRTSLGKVIFSPVVL